jgi:hypothetical protein
MSNFIFFSGKRFPLHASLLLIGGGLVAACVLMPAARAQSTRSNPCDKPNSPVSMPMSLHPPAAPPFDDSGSSHSSPAGQAQVISSNVTSTTEHPGSDAAAQFAMAMHSIDPKNAKEQKASTGAPPLPRFKFEKVKQPKVHDLPPPPVPYSQAAVDHSALPVAPHSSTSTSTVQPGKSASPEQNVPPPQAAPCTAPS